jgi:hypothetical protein
MKAGKQAGNRSSKKSSIGDARLHVGPERAALFLERFANIPKHVGKAKAESLAKVFSDLILGHSGFASVPVGLDRMVGERQEVLLSLLGGCLRDAWIKPSLIRKKLALMHMAGAHMSVDETPEDMREPGDTAPAPEPETFVAVLLYELEHAHLLKYCQNPACLEPYFIAKRVCQNVCSAACAKPAQRDAKLRWWKDHGKEWRQKRKAERRSKISKSPRGEK